MQVDVAVVADYANIAEGSKLNVLGMFDTIFAKAFPARHLYMVLALRLRLDYEDRNKTHSVDIGLFDEDGQQFGGGRGEIEVGAIPPGERSVLSQIMPLPELVFPRAGEYSFILKWDGVEKTRIPLTLAKLPAGPAKADPTVA